MHNLMFFEIANQLLTRQSFYLAPQMNSNTFSFWKVNEVDFLLVSCLLYI